MPEAMRMPIIPAANTARRRDPDAAEGLLSERCSTASAVDLHALFSTTDHRDAALLEAIDRLGELWEQSAALWERANRFAEGGRAQTRLLQQSVATHAERTSLERQICATKALTPLGVAAKINLWLLMHGEGGGTVWDLPRAAMREALAMLGVTA
jgi:hypothetical protein